jgi:surface carbohydrate biosynthesis protein (TIGR04326 family)
MRRRSSISNEHSCKRWLVKVSDSHVQNAEIPTYLIWDIETTPLNDRFKILWRSYDTLNSETVVSIPRLVESNAETLRATYLAWIFHLGESRINKKKIVDGLEIRSGFSYWWMTLFTEKCNYSKSSQINDAIKLLAFDNWAKSQAIAALRLVTENRLLAQCFEQWSKARGVRFTWINKSKSKISRTFLEKIYRAIPLPLRSVLWILRYALDRWSLRGVGLTAWRNTTGQITFFSYLLNLNPSATAQRRYESRYWGSLPEALKKTGHKANWLHIFPKDASLLSAKQAAKVLQTFNEYESEQQHVTLDSFLNFSVIGRTVIEWFRLMRFYITTKKNTPFGPKEKNYLWPLFEKEWRESIFGPTAMGNLLTLNLFESALKDLPTQRRGVYLQENQGWEFALIHAWQTNQHGELIGAPHTSVRYWDLRYFSDARTYSRVGRNQLPLPQRVAVNGPKMFDAFIEGGYPPDDLVNVEALRYLHLCEGEGSLAPSEPRIADCDTLRLLVLTDYLPSQTLKQLNVLSEAMKHLPNLHITVKPHPGCPVRSEDYPLINFTLTHDPIEKLLMTTDIAYTSAVTTAAVDAYCAGIPVLSMLDPSMLNLSPLLGCDDVAFIASAQDLCDALAKIKIVTEDKTIRLNFFTLDKSLPRWRSLLLTEVK